MSPEESNSEILTATGLEVEGMSTFEEMQGALHGDLLIGASLIDAEPHPDADKRLKVTSSRYRH